MTAHQHNFEKWYAQVLTVLYPDRGAGFAILMITFPLLERYLGQKAGLTPKDSLNDAFYDALVDLFPELSLRDTARNFWQVYRNGILHEVTLSDKNRKGVPMTTGTLSHDVAKLHVDSSGDFWINPELFSKYVIEEIRKNFSIFEGSPGAPSQLPTVKAAPTDKGYIVLSTNTLI